MIIALAVITLGSGFILGLVNDWTLEPKAKAKLNQKISAIEQVLPEFDNNPIDDIVSVKPERYTDSVEIYPAFKNQEFIGAAVTGYSDKGYSGLVKLMVGFKADGSIENIAVLEQKETPGLGTKMTNDSFLMQFRTKNPKTFNLEVSKDGGDVDAITGATISTRAFGASVQMAFDEFMIYKQAHYPINTNTDDY
jgi:electron transport complex protein RnfG